MKKFKIYATCLLSLSLMGTAVSSVTPVLANENIVSVDTGMSKITIDGSRLYVHEGRIYEMPEDSSVPTGAQLDIMKLQRGK